MAYCPKCENNYPIITSTSGSSYKVPITTERYNSLGEYIGSEAGGISGIKIEALPRCSNCYSVFEFPDAISKEEFFYAKRDKLVKRRDELKKRYENRCATCGSKESEPNIHWPNSLTQLQKSHIDPQKPLISGNIIPQCQFCNRAYRNYWVFDAKGRVRKLANPSVIIKSDEKVRWEVYKILYKEFKGRNPNE